MYIIKYRNAEEMKISGISTVSKIPDSWKISNAQYYFKIYAGGTPNTNVPTYWDGDIPWINSGKVQNGIIDSESRFITKKGLSKSSTRFIDKDTTVMAMTGATCGNVGYLRIRTTANQSVMAYSKPINSYSKFLFYYLMIQKGQIDQYKTGGAQGGINVENGKKFKIVLPCLSEQKIISNFLNVKTAELDSIISKKEKLIKKLREAQRSLVLEVVTGKVKIDNCRLVKRQLGEMKDSGVEWLGLMPKDWRIKRTKYLLYESNKRSVLGKEEPLSMSQKYGLIRSSDMEQIPNQSLSFKGNKLCKKGDLVFNKLKSHLGVFSVSNQEGIVSPDYAVYRPFKGTNIKFLEYLFKTPLYINEFNKYSKGVGTGLTRLYTSDLFNIVSLLPSLEEQNGIVCYINNKTAEIELLIKTVGHEIQKLKEAKQSLIYEAVTGKIDLRDWEIVE